MSDQASKIIFIISLFSLGACLTFAYGIAVGSAGVWPDKALRVMVDHLRSVYRAGEWQPGGRFVWAPEGAARQRVVIHRPDLFEAGYRAIMAWDGDRYGIWLIDSRGQDAHYWPVEYQKLVPDGPSTLEPHGMYILKDGSILLNFDTGNALARLDACGQPIWVKNGIYHHSIEPAEDGSFWTWRADGSAYGPYQYLVNFNPESGDVIQQYSLIEDFINDSQENGEIFAIPEDYAYGRDDFASDEDLFHPNDLEPLHSSFAEKFPDFDAGDLLVSFRNIDLVAVLDPTHRKIKWWSHGPWRFQHDPDFGSDGKILVYNNNSGRGHRSNVIAIDPASRRLDVAFSDGATKFYSSWAGKLQRLPGGAVLVVVPDEGRVLEALWSGELIFEFNNVWSARANGYVVNAAWMPANFFDQEPSCG
jgi:Arylsulfotransferase (ASST)